MIHPGIEAPYDSLISESVSPSSLFWNNKVSSGVCKLPMELISGFLRKPFSLFKALEVLRHSDTECCDIPLPIATSPIMVNPFGSRSVSGFDAGIEVILTNGSDTQVGYAAVVTYPVDVVKVSGEITIHIDPCETVCGVESSFKSNHNVSRCGIETPSTNKPRFRSFDCPPTAACIACFPPKPPCARGVVKSISQLFLGWVWLMFHNRELKRPAAGSGNRYWPWGEVALQKNLA